MRVNAEDIIHYIRRTGDAQFRAVICLTDNGTNTDKTSTTIDTKCGPVVATGSSTTTFTGPGVVEDAPGVNEISYMELREICEADEEFEIVSQNVSGTVYVAGLGKITNISDTNTMGQMATFSYTIAISGSIDLTDAS